MDGEGLKVGQVLELGYSIEPGAAAVVNAVATSNGRPSHERMAHKMRAMVRGSFMILLTPACSIEELNDDWVAHIKILDFPFISML